MKNTDTTKSKMADIIKVDFDKEILYSTSIPVDPDDEMGEFTVAQIMLKRTPTLLAYVAEKTGYNPFTLSRFFIFMDKYFYDAVNWAVENGITTGTDATHFSPDDLTDRAQFVTFLWRAAGSPEPTGDASAFQDVASDKYYAKAVAWAIENGITNGLTASEFGPTVPVTRAHVVTFLYRFAKATGTYSSDFVDLKKGDFYEDAAGWAVENGITTGIDATHFNPDGPAVRAQTITFLYRYFTKQ